MATEEHKLIIKYLSSNGIKVDHLMAFEYRVSVGKQSTKVWIKESKIVFCRSVQFDVADPDLSKLKKIILHCSNNRLYCKNCPGLAITTQN